MLAIASMPNIDCIIDSCEWDVYVPITLAIPTCAHQYQLLLLEILLVIIYVY